MDALKVLFGIESATYTHNRTNRSIDFVVIGKEKLENSTLQDIQMRLGYHPAGYGYYRPSILFAKKSKTYYHRWQCSNSCD